MNYSIKCMLVTLLVSSGLHAMHKKVANQLMSKRLHNSMPLLPNISSDGNVDEQGQTALHRCVLLQKDAKLVKKLAQKMSLELLDKPDNSGNTALLYACKHRNFALITVLLHCGANPNKQELLGEENGLSPLAVVVQNATSDSEAYKAVCCFLVDTNRLFNTVDVMCASKDGHTPLSIAKERTFTETKKLLMSIKN